MLHPPLAVSAEVAESNGGKYGRFDSVRPGGFDKLQGAGVAALPDGRAADAAVFTYATVLSNEKNLIFHVGRVEPNGAFDKRSAPPICSAARSFCAPGPMMQRLGRWLPWLARQGQRFNSNG
jgi:hypothetical protein